MFVLNPLGDMYGGLDITTSHVPSIIALSSKMSPFTNRICDLAAGER